MGLSDWLRGSSLSKKICLLVGGGALLSYSAYGFYKLYLQQTEQDTEETDDNNERRILILGLDGSGKSTFLSALSQQGHDNAKREDEVAQPTEGFKVMCVSTNGLSLNIWEIGGGENFRVYWPNFTPNTDVLIFAVDSTDQERFAESKEALGDVLRDIELKGVPLILLATKMDLPDASTIKQISEVFDISELSSSRKVFILGTEVPPSGPEVGIGKAQQALLEMCESQSA